MSESMRKLIFNLLLPICALVFGFVSCEGGNDHSVKDPVDYVNPYIGNISHILVPTFPAVHLPHSMLRVLPERGDFTSEYLDGLPIFSVGHRGKSQFKFSVTTGDAVLPVMPMRYDSEHITPYSFDVLLDDGAIKAEYALSHQSAIYNLNASEPVKIVLSSLNGDVEASDNSIKACRTISEGTRIYVYMEAEQMPESSEVSDFDGYRSVVMSFAESAVNLRYGVSFISVEQAEKNLRREIDHYDVRKLALAGRKIWNDALERIAVEGGTEDEKTVFYTSYYRTLERPVCMSEDGRYWSPFDNAVHDDGGVPFYNDDWVWDTYRAAHPLRIIMDEEMEEDILASYLRMAEQKGNMWLPSFPSQYGGSFGMNSNHTIATFADAIAKGLDVDVEKAYTASRNVLLERSLAPWCNNAAGWLDEFYWSKGYIPALKPGEKETDPNVHSFEKRQPVAVTLGTSYDSWCMSKIAEAAGEEDAAGYFHEKSFNYRNLYNPETGFFHPKDKDGKFIEDIDYDFSGGYGARDYYTENNAWVYRWGVQHNIPDLIDLMGGPENFCAELDRMYAQPLGKSKDEFYAMFPDHTGNVGQFSMGNEPSLHIPYLYNYAGAPWKTQRRIRQMLETWFRNDLMGVPGDEDGGGMTSFVVFSSLGFYPVTPGTAEYSIGSPLFEKVTMKLSNGNVFEIKASGASRDNKFIKSAKLNGKPFNSTTISHEDIMKGGCLEFEMTDIPNKSWGK